MKKLIEDTRLPTLLVFALYSSQAWTADTQAAADDVCACLKAPYALVEKVSVDLKAAQASGDYPKMTQAQGEMMSVMNAASNCFEALPAKYPAINQSQQLQAEVMALAEKQCPNPASGFMP